MISKPYQTKSAAEADYYTNYGHIYSYPMCGNKVPRHITECKCEYGPDGIEKQEMNNGFEIIVVCHKCRYVYREDK